MSDYLSAAAIRAWQPDTLSSSSANPVDMARQRMLRSNSWNDGQNLGRRFAIGCVALEITQRCNLDCTLCYLSESSEALKDIPLEEVYRRIDMIRDHYGPNTDVQVTGGDPTLRKREELVAIVRRVAERGMRPTLFTNGIKASREMLSELAEAGLVDVAFHVDLTQERRGPDKQFYTSEAGMHHIREDYIERARGLPINVIFNTTVFDQNYHEIPEIVRFFVKHSDVVHMASFQLQADSGRGVLHERGFNINPETVADQIHAGTGRPVNFNAVSAGHRDCNRYAMTLTADGKVHDLMMDGPFVREFLRETAHLSFDRRDRNRVIRTVLWHGLTHPKFAYKGLAWIFGNLWRMKGDVIRSRGKVGKLTLFIHNFMDAQHLEPERCEACAFTVMTPEGPMSMCVHNAKRDDYLLVPSVVKEENELKYFNPVSGRLEDTPPERIEVSLTRKNARGRAKTRIEAERGRAVAGMQ